ERSRVRVTQVPRETVPLGGVQPRFDTVYAAGEDRDREDHTCIKKLIFVREISDLFVVSGDGQPPKARQLLLHTELEHVLLVGQDRLHAGLTGCHRERGKRGCLFRARQQQVFGRGRLKQPIVGSAYYRLSGREEVRDSDSRTELVLVHEQFVVIESQTRINREILEWRETILNVARPRSPSAPVAEHERVCSRKGKNRIGENVSLRILDRREECRVSRIEREVLTYRGPSKLNPGLQRMSVTGIGVRADEPPIGQSSVLKGHDGSRL